ncbi:hypothetical protein A1O3_06284 [Capronia epimyces CBS 606.96]|uniref:Enoyl-CoA hydratase n=1 Tax=Capronia epimyces CBS 606.96 TaxID=1182542 RepID=W9XZS4_9EURO|nr:uncharacterized protein A1O3_06284 [Capronia epimyces CBS 606.96]EXJ82471.1 hypothetical protein A1O3_06284 [Capronia epimyces CBS 606.96]
MASSSKYPYTDVIFGVKGKIGIIKLNRPRSLNAFGGTLLPELASAIRELNEHPDTVFTVLTGEGRFFSSGADVKARNAQNQREEFPNPTAKKLNFMASQTTTSAVEILRSLIDHKKVLVLALNGPAVGGGAAWFTGVADIVLAAERAYLQVPFSELALVPEFGSATSFAQSIGVHRANDFLLFGRKLTVEELEQWGLVNRIFPSEGFHDQVIEFLEGQLAVNDGKSMMEAKRLQNIPLRKDRLLAVYDAADALAERVMEGAPDERFAAKNRELHREYTATLEDVLPSPVSLQVYQYLRWLTTTD